MTKRRRKLGAALVGIAIVAAGCGTTVEPNEVGVYTNNGPLEGCCDVEIVEPSSRKIEGIYDELVTYPIDQRSWISDVDRPQIEFVSKDGLRMRAPFELRFRLNQNPDVLREFHQLIGKKKSAWTEEGWVAMLQEYLDPPFERAVDAAGLLHNWRDLRESDEARSAFERDARRQFTDSLETALGGPFFCGIEHNGPESPCGEVYFTIGQPTPVELRVVEAIESEQAANAQRQALSAEELRAAAEAKARQALLDQLGPALYVCLETAKIAERTGQPVPPCYAGLDAQPMLQVGGQQ